MRLLFLLALLVSVCAATAPSPMANAPAITILSCVVGARADDRPGVRVSFRNDSALDLTRIVWRVRVYDGWIDYTQDGDFAPGSTTVRSLFSNTGEVLGYYRNGVENCAAVATTAKSGESWLMPGASLDPDRYFPREPKERGSPGPLSSDLTRDPIEILRCGLDVFNIRKSFFAPLHGRAHLATTFRNVSTKRVTAIVLRATYLSGGLDFAYGYPVDPGGSVTTSQVKNMLGTPVLSATLVRDDLPVVPEFMSGLDPSECTVVNVRFADGPAWVNPDVGPTEPPMPTAPPTLAP